MADENNTPERKPNSAASAPASTSPKIETGPLMTLYQNLKDLIEPVGKTVVAFDAMSQSGPKAAGVIKDIASFGGTIGAAAGKFVGALDQSAQDAQLAAKRGLGGLDVTNLGEQLRRGNLTIKEYVELMGKQGPYLQGLGKNADESSQRIIQMTDAARQMPGGVGDALRKYNFTLTDEMARITSIGSMNATKVDMNNKAQRDSLAKANAELALQIQSQANLTGKSRDAIEAELEERLKQPEVAARMRLMTEDQRESFIKAQVALTGFGETAQKTAANIGIGGRITPEQRQFLQSLGGKGAAEFQRGSALAARGKTPQDQAAGRALMEKAMADAAVYRTGPEFARVMAQGGPLAEAFKKAQAEDTTSIRIKQLLEKNPSLTPAQAARQARQEAGIVKPNEQTTEGQKIAVGRQNLEGKANEAAIEAAKQINIYAKAEGGADALKSAMDKLGDKLFDVKDKGEEARKKLKEVVDELNGVGTSKTPNEKGTSTYAAPNVPKFDKNTPAPATTTPAPATTTPATATPAPTTTVPAVTPPATTPAAEPKKEGAIERAWNNWFGDKKPISRANTSLGDTGSLIEKFSAKGTPALLHNEEGVVNLDQLNNIARGSRNAGIESMMSNIKSYTGGAQPKSMPNLDVSQMFEGIKTKVSSINTPKIDYNPNAYINSTLKQAPATETTTTNTLAQQTATQGPIVSTDSVTIKDLNEQLMRLNTGIMQLVQHSAKSVDLNQAQIKATKSLSGNKYA